MMFLYYQTIEFCVIGLDVKNYTKPPSVNIAIGC